MASNAAELRDAIKQAMLTTVEGQRVVDKACRTAKAVAVGKCIDVEYLRAHLRDMNVVASRSVEDDMFTSLDPDSDGVVDFHAFLKTVCGAQARDFVLAMRNLISSDTVKEAKLRKVERHKRLLEAAASEITDPFQLLKAKLEALGTSSFREVFKRFRCRSAQCVCGVAHCILRRQAERNPVDDT
jgi:hypothetical protein